jgi:hypothetical protein
MTYNPAGNPGLAFRLVAASDIWAVERKVRCHIIGTLLWISARGKLCRTERYRGMAGHTVGSRDPFGCAQGRLFDCVSASLRGALTWLRMTEVLSGDWADGRFLHIPFDG